MEEMWKAGKDGMHETRRTEVQRTPRRLTTAVHRRDARPLATRRDIVDGIWHAQGRWGRTRRWPQQLGQRSWPAFDSTAHSCETGWSRIIEVAQADATYLVRASWGAVSSTPMCRPFLFPTRLAHSVPTDGRRRRQDRIDGIFRELASRCID